MDEFIHKIEHKLVGKDKRLSIVSNPDGFLKRSDTQQEVLSKCGLLLLPISSILELRVRYEVYDKISNEKVCYIIDDFTEIVPDMKAVIHFASTFAISDLLPACNSSVLQNESISFRAAYHIYMKRFVSNLSAYETKEIINEVKSIYGQTADEYITQLDAVSLKWDDVATIDGISKIVLKAIKQGIYSKLENKINDINSDFQKYIDAKYFSLPSSSHVSKPKMVNKILPHLAYKYERTAKIALVVVDGMAYWQYLILEKQLNNYDLKTKNEFTFSWIPSITKLSRQAIFRGDTPRDDYKQSPDAEAKLWNNYWLGLHNSSKRMHDYEIGYSHGSLLADDTNRYKQAFVDVSLDHKMHSSSHNMDLYALTENWATETAENINLLHKQGYKIVITTDHGNIMAHSWRALNSQERTLLYEKESRGSRHLMYSKQEYLNDFLEKNSEIENELLVHDKWAVWRNNQCFKGQDEITHGGSHFLEVMIPFVTIE